MTTIAAAMTKEIFPFIAAASFCQQILILKQKSFYKNIT